MPRYILIDSNSGYIWGDSGDIDGPARDEAPIDAARRLDESLREYGRIYTEVNAHELDGNQSGYRVYCADVDGSEAVPLVVDGQNPETIREVKELCRYVTSIRIDDSD
jgi:hypothetical protein